MNHIPDGHGVDAVEEDEITGIYGDAADGEALLSLRKKIKFEPWHHPVKQLIRRRQWVAQVDRLIGQEQGRVISYLSLPGADMLDVRVLGESVQKNGGAIRLLGFNSRQVSNDETGVQLNAESVLRQEGIITDDSLTLPDRLQDIAVGRSHAAAKLAEWGTFDVINIDLCDHFGSAAPSPNMFDVIERIVAHQRVRTRPWLLMITTRVDPENVGLAREKFSKPIDTNLAAAAQFEASLVEALALGEESIGDELAGCWGKSGEPIAKIFAIGMGKYLLHFLHNQIQDPAKVELASCFGYRVYGNDVDMLSTVFRIKPIEKVIIAVGVEQVDIPEIEISSALQIVRKAGALIDGDAVLNADQNMMDMVEDTEKMLSKVDYDISGYRPWLRALTARACQV